MRAPYAIARTVWKDAPPSRARGKTSLPISGNSPAYFGDGYENRRIQDKVSLFWPMRRVRRESIG